MTNTVLHLYAFLIILQIFDAYTTYKAIKQGGREINPFLVKLADVLKPITNAKWAWLFIAKLVAVVAGYVLYVMNQPEALVVLCVFYIYVVFHNFRELARGN